MSKKTRSLFGTITLRAVTLILIILFLFTRGTDQNEGVSTVLANESISLENRMYNPWMNEVYKDNILLTMAYLRGVQSENREIDWNRIRQPFTYTFSLKPQETFAFHKDVLPQFNNRISKETRAQFSYNQGFKSDGYLVGMGVCHLASLIHKAALEANLYTKAPSNHDFAAIPEISREYGVAIYSGDTNQNLYVVNNKSNPIEFMFNYNGNNLTVSIYETPNTFAVIR